MRSSFRILFFRAGIFALVLALTLHGVATISSRAAQDSPQTRPRRVGTPAPPPTPEARSAFESEPEAPPITSEPTMRIGLSTDALSVTISTTGRLLNASDAQSPPLPLEVSRVRVEARALPVPARRDPERPEDETRAAKVKTDIRTSEPQRESDTVGAQPAGEVEIAAGNSLPASAGNARTILSDSSPESSPGKVRLSARVVAPSRGAVVYAAGAPPLLHARAPLLFASDDETQHPMKFNEKPYRGRLEVFANIRGTLTVVNIVGLEDYVRGVVANELSPGGYPALEALKAQAVAARTYAVTNRGQFAIEGFDLLPTTRSQVYGGLSTEQPLSDRAVFETRGRVATFRGQPINALYTSTCGGRTEDAEDIFGGAPVPYLRARECAVEGKEAFTPFVIRTTREVSSIREAEHAASARDVALLATHHVLSAAPRLSDEWLSAAISVDEVRALLTSVASLARQLAPPPVSNDVVRPGPFSSALARALDGESRGDVLLAKADVDYLLAFRDADDVPAANRADVAELLREGHLALFPDATLRPHQTMTRARVLHAVAHALDARELLNLQKAAARPAAGESLVLRPVGRGLERTLNVAPDVYLFRAFGDALYQVRELTLVGGEAVAFHTDARGAVDYLEMRPSPNGAAADRFSSHSNWKVELTPIEAAARLGRSSGRTGALVDLRVRARGASRRVLDLEVIGTHATAHVTGGKIRSALNLREQLFVIDRRYDEEGHVVAFVFTGRGWGHGVGMCQVGAYGLARSGLTYDRILRTYYTGISLTKLY